ncbi:MAG TPA: VanZ family protein [Aquabacterium sp.]|nr:VanZ family protein [Aquabacterium sp.]
MRSSPAMAHATGVSRSSAVPLAWAWAGLIVYASLFPFDGWRWPPGAQAWQLLRLAWPRYFIPFDIAGNLLAYAPLGGLAALAALRHGRGPWLALAGAVLLGSAMSYAMEVVQHLLPQRVPSLLDWVLNSAGTLLGALLVLAGNALGLLRRWQAARDRWLDTGNAGALALLVLWPVALLFPTPVPLGLGQVGEVLRDALSALLVDVPWAQPLADWLVPPTDPVAPLSPQAEALAVMLGLLSPCLLAFSAARPGWRRLGLALGAAALAIGATTLSTALNFGPDHALAWRTPGTLAALGVALLLALAALWLPPRLAGALALVALTGGAVLVHGAPTDPYYADSLQGWEQGRFVRFHGVAQWLGWLWPYAAMGWLLARVGRR